jgi:hypothetical protein
VPDDEDRRRVWVMLTDDADVVTEELHERAAAAWSRPSLRWLGTCPSRTRHHRVRSRGSPRQDVQEADGELAQARRRPDKLKARLDAKQAKLNSKLDAKQEKLQASLDRTRKRTDRLLSRDSDERDP